MLLQFSKCFRFNTSIFLFTILFHARGFYGFLQMLKNFTETNYHSHNWNSITWSFIQLAIQLKLFIFFDILMYSLRNSVTLASIICLIFLSMQQCSVVIFRFSDSLHLFPLSHRLCTNQRSLKQNKWIIETNVQTNFIINFTIHNTNGDELRESASEFGQIGSFNDIWVCIKWEWLRARTNKTEEKNKQ